MTNRELLSVPDQKVSFTHFQRHIFLDVIKKDRNYLIYLDGKRYYCPVEVALDVIGGKWKGVIIWYLLEGPLRFSELRQTITTVSEKVLIRELRALEKAGLVTRTVYPQAPPRVDYALSALGATLRPLVEHISAFGETYSGRFGQVQEVPL
jgi:DNA-binding HxlR family transcriptional regulator